METAFLRKEKEVEVVHIYAMKLTEVTNRCQNKQVKAVGHVNTQDHRMQ